MEIEEMKELYQILIKIKYEYRKMISKNNHKPLNRKFVSKFGGCPMENGSTPPRKNLDGVCTQEAGTGATQMYRGFIHCLHSTPHSYNGNVIYPIPSKYVALNKLPDIGQLNINTFTR
jgi:hypothetical protein